MPPAEDPTILSGTLRSTLDVFDEYEDAEIVRVLSPCLPRSCAHGLPQYEALRRVHLIPTGEVTAEENEGVNVNVFRNLDSPVSEGGENFSTGYVVISDEWSSYCPIHELTGTPHGGACVAMARQREAAALHGPRDPETFQGASDGRGTFSVPENGIMGNDEVLIVATCCIRRLQGTAHSHDTLAYMRSDEHPSPFPRAASIMLRTSLSERRFASESQSFFCFRSAARHPARAEANLPQPISDPTLFARVLREFASSTILTIAHRLRTVIDYDRVSLSVSTVRTSPAGRNL